MINERKLIKAMGNDPELKKLSTDFLRKTIKYRYTYNFSWLGLSIIQCPQDIVAVQEIIWKVKPDLIIETGIAHGGSLILAASILELIGKGKVVGIDIDIREHNKIAIERHPLHKRITMIEGSSIDKDTFEQVCELAKDKKKVLVFLDSNHSHKHVLKEMELYSKLVTKGSYMIVFDTAIEDMPDSFFADRPWGKGNNPKTAVWEFLKNNNCFKIDREIEDKLLITAAPDGYIKRIK